MGSGFPELLHRSFGHSPQLGVVEQIPVEIQIEADTTDIFDGDISFVSLGLPRGW